MLLAGCPTPTGSLECLHRNGLHRKAAARRWPLLHHGKQQQPWNPQAHQPHAKGTQRRACLLLIPDHPADRAHVQPYTSASSLHTKASPARKEEAAQPASAVLDHPIDGGSRLSGALVGHSQGRQQRLGGEHAHSTCSTAAPGLWAGGAESTLAGGGGAAAIWPRCAAMSEPPRLTQRQHRQHQHQQGSGRAQYSSRSVPAAMHTVRRSVAGCTAAAAGAHLQRSTAPLARTCRRSTLHGFGEQ